MILAIIQARMGSSRLQGKVLMDLAGRTVIEHVYNRVSQSKFIDDIIVATSIDTNNLPLIGLCCEKGIRVFCGSENNVLDRFYQIAKLIKPKLIVRITADCPLHDAGVIDYVIESHNRSNCDYTSNAIIPTFPDGLDVEVFSFEALEDAWNNATLPSEREHVTPYIRSNKSFQIQNVKSNFDYSSKRWTLDEKNDFEFISLVYNNFSPNVNFNFKDILNFLDNNPEIEDINSNIIRNEGLLKSLENDNNIK